MPRPESKDKRRTRRIEPYLAPCRLLVGRRRLAAYVTNLSARGARVYCDETPPRVGQRVTLELRLKARTGHSRLPAETRWTRIASDVTELSSFGVTFKGLKPEERRAIESVLLEFRRRADVLAEAVS